MGLDGTVNAIEPHLGTVVMGGMFTHAALDAGAILHSGGLVAWDLGSKDWLLVGRTPLKGTVSAMRSTAEGLYVAGRFRSIDGKDMNNIALHSGPISEPGGWLDVGGGIHGGHVSALLAFGRELFAGGSFMQAGTRQVRNIARWDGTAWQPLADDECQRRCKHVKDDDYVCQDLNCELEGTVTALASTGSVIFAAGVFDLAGGRSVKNIAQYFDGMWKPVLGGVLGSVFDLQVFSLTPPSSYFESRVQDVQCVYVAGDLNRAINGDGTSQIVQGVVRACMEQTSLESTAWEVMEGDRTGPVFALLVSPELAS